MTDVKITYNVHIYREMRLFFPGIAADSHEGAAKLASQLPTEEAEYTESCDGQDLAALVDVAGDEDFRQTKAIDFEPELLRKAAAELLTALKETYGLLKANGYDSRRAASAIALAEGRVLRSRGEEGMRS